MIGNDGIKTCEKAINVNGNAHQEQMLVEELAELIVAINQFRRERISLSEVISEIADVYITLQQFQCIYMFSDGWLKAEIKRKLIRLEDTLTFE